MSAVPPLDYSTPRPALPPKRSGCGPVGWIICGIIVLVVLVAALAIAVGPRKTPGPGSKDVALSDFYQQLKAGNVASIEIDSDMIEGTFRRSVTLNGTALLQFRTALPQGTSGNWTFTQMVLDTPATPVVRAAPSNGLVENVLLPLIPWLLILAFIWFFVIRQLRKNNSTRTPMPVVIVNPEAR